MLFPLMFEHLMVHWDSPHSMVMRVIVFWLLVLSTVTSRTESTWVAISVFNASHAQTIGKTQELLVPVGVPTSLTCESLKTALEAGHKAEQVRWIKRCTNSALIVYPLEPGEWRYTASVDETELFVENIQLSEDAFFDCHTLLEGGNEWASRVRIVVQDCGDKDSYDDYNPKNPCQNGGNCRLVEYSEGIDLFFLRCECMAQFTGKFCNVAISSNIDFYELMFYAPFMFHTVVFAVGGILFTRFLTGRREKSVTNEKTTAPVISPSKDDLKKVEIK